MPWCPRCDEVFPEGPACPRCRAALVEVSGVTQAEEHAPVVLPHVRLPRRLRRAIGGHRPPAPPPRHLIAVAVSLVLVAGGFTLGRMSAVPPDSPALRAPPVVGPRLATAGSVAFLRPGGGPAEYTLVRARLRTGMVELAGRFMSPYPQDGHRESARVSGLRGSVAVVLTGPEGRSSVAAFAVNRPPVLWLDGQEAAWEDADSLLIRDGTRVVRWRFTAGPEADAIAGTWRRVIQTAVGAVLEGPTETGVALHLSRPEGPVRLLDLPPGASTLAVAPAGTPALVSVDDTPSVWDGSRLTPVEVDDAYRPRGAAFSHDGARIALVLQRRDRPTRSAEQHLAVLDRTGARVELLKLPAAHERPMCDAVPTWNADGRWLFVGPGDRSVHAVEVGGRRHRSEVHDIGCGLAWAGDARDAGG